MSDNASSLEVARDITIAVLEKGPTSIFGGTADDIATKVGKVFDAVFEKVKEKNGGRL